jgi:CHAT domain-containing protein
MVCLADKLGHGQGRGTRIPTGCSGQDGLEEKYFGKLVAPLLPHVRHERLILVPHGVLHYVPFAALRDPVSKRSLLEMKTVSYTPSVSVLRFLAGKASPFDGNVLVMGDPETDPAAELKKLPWAREEARTVAELLGTVPLVGAEASESTLRGSAGKVDVLHLAAHGVYRPLTPRFSHVALAPGGGDDGFLEVEEVFSALDLRGVNLVTLSACQTALGERTDGDDIIGLTRAFLYAGSPAVVSTLWRVDDQATAFLMKAFYERLLAGATYAEALRTAQIETSRQSDWDDPYYWAAFTLSGDAEGRWHFNSDVRASESVNKE